nr:hypothetical protein [Tanacetum cinerariifolium]
METDGVTPCSPQKQSFADAIAAEKKTQQINFRSLINKNQVKNSDCVLPVANVLAAQSNFANSLVGFFVGKNLAFQLVQNYVTNTWSKFGFQKVMRDDDDVYYFKFTSKTGLKQVLEKRQWLIRNQPLILTKWSPNITLSKDKVTKVPVWVKIHKVPIVAYSKDGLSLIAIQIGKPIMLDAFTSVMCAEPWGRIGFTRALIVVVQKMKFLKKPLRKLMHDQGNLHDRMNRLRFKLDEVQKAIDHDPSNSSLRDEEAVNGKLLKEINHTFLALIHKEVVSKNQSAFVSGRRISDNILITQELMHNYHHNRDPPRCAFKVDIQKAYDTVDWRFLGFILKCFGFHPTMISWIITCVTSVHNRFASTVTFMATLKIINVCFAHDLFIFARGDINLAKVIMDSLDEFKSVSRLIPSIPKSMAFFCNVLNHVKMVILNIMSFAKDELPVKHLGVMLISSRLLNRDCKVLVEKSRNRIGDLKSK